MFLIFSGDALSPFIVWLFFRKYLEQRSASRELLREEQRDEADHGASAVCHFGLRAEHGEVLRGFS